MAKIECPHCQAVNQDISTNDPCWKCGTVLSAPISALSTGIGPPTSQANSSATSAAKPPTKVQQALAESEAPVAQAQASPAKSPPIYAEPQAKRSHAMLYMCIGIAVVAIGLLLVAYVLNRTYPVPH